MKLTDILLILFTGGCWLYCLSDAAMTPAGAYRGLPKWAWVAIIAATFIVGAIMWLLVQSSCRRSWDRVSAADRPATQAARALHPAGRHRDARVRQLIVGPDDDAEFLLHLARVIKESRG
jgi:peptidoglycan/LPS O-acetylase OafA/YrhL